MSEILAIAESSMLTDLFRLDVISNNLANASTPGFRRDLALTPSFGDALGRALATGDALALGLASESLPGATLRVTDHRPGSLRVTGRALDVALDEHAFLELGGADGPVYSRMGNLSLDATGRLLGAGGLPVLGTGGEIQLSGAEPRIDPDGSIWEADVEVGRLKLVRIDDPRGLQKLGNGLYVAGESLEPTEDPALRVHAGHLEGSNVSVTEEMVLLIDLVRRFETTQRLVQSYDDSMTQALRTIGDL